MKALTFKLNLMLTRNLMINLERRNSDSKGYIKRLEAVCEFLSRASLNQKINELKVVYVV